LPWPSGSGSRLCESVSQMPRTAIGSSRGLALRSNGQNAEANKNKNVKSSVVGFRAPTQTKNGGNKVSNKTARAALGEITNATNAEKAKSLKSQVKKGISSIVGKGSKLSVGTSSSSSSSHSTVAEQIEKSVQKTHEGRRSRGSSGDKSDLSALSEETSTTNSLPSSQEEESVKKLRENLIDTDLNFSKSSSSDSEDTYHSASEGDDANGSIVCSNPYRYAPPARVVPPAGVHDFDLANMNDPSTCSEYAAEVFQYYKDREEQFRCRNYMSNQPEITEIMRAILVDWLVEVQESFELNHETLYTAVKMMDLYMSKVLVPKEELQLVGATACLVACKIDERIPPNLDDFVYVCDDAYTRKDIIRKEQDMISVVEYDVGYPLSYRFLRRYGRVCRVSMPDLTFARYILELSLMDYQFNVETSESLLAAATLVLALKIKNVKDWMESLQFYSGYSISDIQTTLQSLLSMLQRPPNEHTKTIRLKYSHRVFYEAATVAIPQTVDLTDI